VQGRVHEFVNDVKIPHQVGDSAVAITRQRFGYKDVIVDAQRAAGGVAHRVDEGLYACFERDFLDQGGDGDGSRVDHGIKRAGILGVEFDGVEGVTARFDSDVLKNFFVTKLLNRHAEGEGLGNGLNCEALVAIASFENAAIRSRNARSEMVRIRFSEFRYVCR